MDSTIVPEAEIVTITATNLAGEVHTLYLQLSQHLLCVEYVNYMLWVKLGLTYLEFPVLVYDGKVCDPNSLINSYELLTFHFIIEQLAYHEVPFDKDTKIAYNDMCDLRDTDSLDTIISDRLKFCLWYSGWRYKLYGTVYQCITGEKTDLMKVAVHLADFFMCRTEGFVTENVPILSGWSFLVLEPKSFFTMSEPMLNAYLIEFLNTVPNAATSLSVRLYKKSITPPFVIHHICSMMPCGLVILDFYCVKIGDDLGVQLVKYIPNTIKKLSLCKSEIGPKTAHELAIHLPPHVILDVNENNLQEGIVPLVSRRDFETLCVMYTINMYTDEYLNTDTIKTEELYSVIADGLQLLEKDLTQTQRRALISIQVQVLYTGPCSTRLRSLIDQLLE